jgi:hypothetical protein
VNTLEAWKLLAARLYSRPVLPLAVTVIPPSFRQADELVVVDVIVMLTPLQGSGTVAGPSLLLQENKTAAKMPDKRIADLN